MSYVVLNLTMLDKLSIVDWFSRVIKSFLIINSIKNILILCLLKISHCHITFINLVYSFSKLNHHTHCSVNWVFWWNINWSAWCCFALKFNCSSCSWLIFFSSLLFLSKVTSSYFTLFLWSSCTKSQCSLSCKVKFCWLQSLFSILMTLLSWLLT